MLLLLVDYISYLICCFHFVMATDILQYYFKLINNHKNRLSSKNNKPHEIAARFAIPSKGASFFSCTHIYFVYDVCVGTMIFLMDVDRSQFGCCHLAHVGPWFVSTLLVLAVDHLFFVCVRFFLSLFLIIRLLQRTRGQCGVIKFNLTNLVMV